MQSFNQGTLAVEQVTERGRAPCTVLRLGGEHDVATAGALRDALADADAAAVVVDLTDCTFADSSIISVLLHARRERPAFAVVLPSDPTSAVVRAFDITDVTAHLACCASLHEARRLIEPGPPPPSA
jgi:anti-anti-sigma factor